VSQSPSPAELQAFILSHTVEAAPPLVPEVKLRLSSTAIPLWEATEVLYGRTGLPPPYWAFAWPGGQAIARYILDHPETVRNRLVLDFASGCGLVAFAAKRAGALSVTASEIDPLSLEAMRLNQVTNGLSIEISIEDLIGVDGGWHTVLAGDVCYEKPMAEKVIRWLRQLAVRGATVLIGDPGRNYFEGKGLLELERYLVPTSRDLEDKEVRSTGVWSIIEQGAL